MFIERIANLQRRGPATIPLPRMSMASQPASGPNRLLDGNGNSSKIAKPNRNGSHSANLLRQDGKGKPHGRAQDGPPRVALYSHDTMGLGHLRRNLLIAQALAQSPLQATSLLITGAHEANFFALPQGADCLTLPRLRKERDGSYRAGQLAISMEDLICLRAESIRSALATFQPDVLVVDKVPTGAFGEMLPTLRALARQSGTQCVLGIRDVLDDPNCVRDEWEEAASGQVIDEFFDEIWVYGDRQVYDPVLEYRWPKSIADKVRFTGYLNQESRLSKSASRVALPIESLGHPNDRLIVCTLGGGQDGYLLGENFLQSLPERGHFGVLLAGPFMPAEQLGLLQEMAASRANVVVLDFAAEADQLIRQADCVIAMGGYNTVCSVLSFRKRALIVPRVFPRKEQWIRAERLEQLGLLDLLHPQQLSPETLHQWIVSEPALPPNASSLLDFTGMKRVPQLCGALLGKQHQLKINALRERV